MPALSTTFAQALAGSTALLARRGQRLRVNSFSPFADQLLGLLHRRTCRHAPPCVGDSHLSGEYPRNALPIAVSSSKFISRNVPPTRLHVVDASRPVAVVLLVQVADAGLGVREGCRVIGR